jgi:hypothetical protein
MSQTPRTVAASAGHLLELLRLRGGMSRQQLLAETGMSRGTLYGRLDALARLGFVYEAESLAATGGRPARRIRFDDRGRVLLTVDLGQTHARIAVTDLLGSQLRRAVLPLDVAAGPAVVLGPVLEHAAKLLAVGATERLAGLGVGVPAPVDPTSGAIVRATWPGWSSDVVADSFGLRWSEPIVVENDARAAAVGESRSPDETLVYVKLATGLGCGVVVDGEVLRGAVGSSSLYRNRRARRSFNIGSRVGASSVRIRCSRMVPVACTSRRWQRYSSADQTSGAGRVRSSAVVTGRQSSDARWPTSTIIARPSSTESCG